MSAAQTPTQLRIDQGVTVVADGREYLVIRVVSLSEVLARDTETGGKVFLPINGLGLAREVNEATKLHHEDIDLHEVPEEHWELAKRRLDWIKPLIDTHYHRLGALAARIAKEADTSQATVYRWVNDYRATGRLSSLIPKTRSRGGKGTTRVHADVEAIISDVLENYHDTDQKPTIAETATEIRRRCSNAGLPLPGYNTIRRRLDKSDGPERTRKRLGFAEAEKRHEPHKGSIPDADWPYAIVQIDHTLLPVIIVDDVHRKPINRACITLAIDVYSRVCMGMHLSLEAPSAISAGMCVSHAILPKDKWLRDLGMNGNEWPVWGVMTALHMDNANEFRGMMLRTACREYDIDIHLRPLAKPRYGAHIERLMGTVSERLKAVKGATFSGPDERGEYDAEGNACMTFGELERWLALLFYRYHNEKHDGIETTPLRKLEEGLLGVNGRPGRGLPARRTDEDVLRIRFTPFIERTIQPDGVVIDNLHYYHDVLRPWIKAPNPDFPKYARKFRFHRDPRDISLLYFYDELTHRYCAIPYRDTSLPPVSVWEHREARRIAVARGADVTNEKLIFSIINDQRELEATSAEKTKVARRNQQRRIQHKKHREQKRTHGSGVVQVEPSMPPTAVVGYDPDKVVLFDD